MIGVLPSVKASFAMSAVVGGLHVALVNMSTNFRMKNFGNVPPRFETVASRVMYVPPIAGSAIRAWKAEIATNIIVLINVL